MFLGLVMSGGLLPSVQEKYQVVAFLDNDKTKWGSEFNDISVSNPEIILSADYDVVVIASLAGVNFITEQLFALGVERGKISTEYVDLHVKSRIVFLEKLGEVFSEQGVLGCVAECGVFQGEFALEINRVFPDKKLYLFDTFSGFDKRDVVIEHKRGYSKLQAGHFNVTSEEIVLCGLPYPKICCCQRIFS